jgi:SOS response regulatory protein OraA/RecX
MAQTNALETALRALRHRDLSAQELEERLRARGFSDAERTGAMATLGRTGLVDDARFAELRAASLAARGAGDELIRHTLQLAGVASELIEVAVGAVEPEAERARLIVERRGSGPKTGRYLSAKGFSQEVVASAVAGRSEEELG